MGAHGEVQSAGVVTREGLVDAIYGYPVLVKTVASGLRVTRFNQYGETNCNIPWNYRESEMQHLQVIKDWASNQHGVSFMPQGGARERVPRHPRPQGASAHTRDTLREHLRTIPFARTAYGPADYVVHSFSLF
jgi:hypothetical protein